VFKALLGVAWYSRKLSVVVEIFR